MENEISHPDAWNRLWRSIVVGLLYVTVQTVVLRLLTQPEAGIERGSVSGLLLQAASGLVIALAIWLLTPHVHGSARRYAVIWGFILLLNGASVIIEGNFFSPAAIAGMLPALLITISLASLVLAGGIAWMFPPVLTSVDPHPVKPRGPVSWVWRFIVSAFTYLMTYLVFGAVNYALVTRPYYDAHAGGLNVPSDPAVIFMAEAIRAPMIVLSVLPLVIAMSQTGTRRRAAIAAGLILFVIGGVVPLIPVTTLPLFLRIASLWEIFAQNFVTGLVIGWLLGYAPAHAVQESAAMPVMKSAA